MITVYALADAASVAFFGMFALWAAASKLHWFLRTAVVAGAILFTLLIPAYEVLVSLSVETLCIVAGMIFWRRRRSSKVATSQAVAPSPVRLRLSMETLMLAVVVIAVLTAVAARFPTIAPESWYSNTVNGFVAAMIALACVWLVCSRTRWWVRTVAFPALVFLMALARVSLNWAGHIVRYWLLVTNGSIAEYLKIARRDIWPATFSWCTTIAFEMLVLCIWLYTVRRAGWFDPFGELSGNAQLSSHERRFMLAARACAVILFGVAAIFPIMLFYALLTPTPIPNTPLPNPNGFDDLIAAGNMIGPTAGRTLQNWDQLTVAQLGAELAKHQRAFDLMNRGLQRRSRNPYVFGAWPPENSRSFIYLQGGLVAQGAMARRTRNLEQELAHNLTLLRLAQEEGRGGGVGYFSGVFPQAEKDGYTGIWNCVGRLSAAKCIELVVRLREIELQREPWEEREAVQRAFDDNAGWQQHAHRVLADWSGKDPYKWQRIEECRRVAQLRMLIVKLAIRAYQWGNNDQLPESLDALVPRCLPEVPIDPFGGKKLKYRMDGYKYVLYSCGPDEDDDGGQPRAVENGVEIGDMTDAALFNPPIFQPYIGPP
jgi:hypothetical protein